MGEKKRMKKKEFEVSSHMSSSSNRKTRPLRGTELENLYGKTQELVKSHFYSAKNPHAKIPVYAKCDHGLECFTIPIFGVNTYDAQEVIDDIRAHFPPGTKLDSERNAESGDWRLYLNIPLKVPKDEDEADEPKKKKHLHHTHVSHEPPSFVSGMLYLSGLIFSGGILAVKIYAGHFDKLLQL